MELRLIKTIVYCFLAITIFVPFVIPEHNIRKVDFYTNKSEPETKIYNLNDWLEDSVGCLKKRSPELSDKLIKEYNLENCSIEEFKKVFGEPNKIHVDSTNSRIELTYYFDSFCKDGRIDLEMDYCWIEYVFIKNKLIGISVACI